jgi:hypothetical protein
MAQESGPVPGWQQAVFASPIPISANTTYVVAYYAPTGEYAATPYGLSQAVSSGPLTAAAASAVGGNGAYRYYERFPARDYQDTNYLLMLRLCQALIADQQCKRQQQDQQPPDPGPTTG